MPLRRFNKVRRARETTPLSPVYSVIHAVGRANAAMRIFLINLDRTPERLADFRRVNSHLKDVSRFSAVDGRTIDRKKLVERGIFTEGVSYTDGAIGNALSHLRLWKQAIELGEPITVTEDDAIFHFQFESWRLVSSGNCRRTGISSGGAGTSTPAPYSTCSRACR